MTTYECLEMDEETQKRQPCGLICISPQRLHVTLKTFVEQYNSYCNFFPKNLSKQNKKENNLKKTKPKIADT